MAEWKKAAYCKYAHAGSIPATTSNKIQTILTMIEVFYNKMHIKRSFLADIIGERAVYNNILRNKKHFITAKWDGIIWLEYEALPKAVKAQIGLEIGMSAEEFVKGQILADLLPLRHDLVTIWDGLRHGHGLELANLEAWYRMLACVRLRTGAEESVYAPSIGILFLQKEAFADQKQVFDIAAKLMQHGENKVKSLKIGTGESLRVRVCRFKKEVLTYGDGYNEDNEAYAKRVADFFYGGLARRAQNSRTVDDRLVEAMKIIAFQPHKPNWEQIAHELRAFLSGKRGEFVNKHTGEVISPEKLREACITADGRLKSPNASTVRRYLWENLANRAAILEVWGGKSASKAYTPHHRRHRGAHSFSQWSMDDRQHPFDLDLPDSAQKLWSYAVMDNLSEYYVGWEFAIASRAVSADLPRKALLKAIQNCGGRLPKELQLEKRLNKGADFYESGLIGLINYSVNPNGKAIERFFRSFRGLEMELKGFRGRPWANNPRNLIENNYGRIKKVEKWDVKALKSEINALYEQWNDSLHSDQTRYKGLTRREVFEQNARTDVAVLTEAQQARYFTEPTRTSIARNAYVRGFNEVWQLPAKDKDTYKELFERLQGKEVQLYRADAESTTAYLWQNDVFVCELHLDTTYNAFAVERNVDDWDTFGKQQQALKAHEQALRENKAYKHFEPTLPPNFNVDGDKGDDDDEDFYDKLKITG